MGRDQDFPLSIEVQLPGGNGRRERPTLNLCTPGTHMVMRGRLVTQHRTPSRSKTCHGDQWVRSYIVKAEPAACRAAAEGRQRFVQID